MPSQPPLSPSSRLSAATIWPQPRALREDEWPALRVAVNKIFRPDGGDLTHDSPLLFDAGNRDNLRVIVPDGAPGPSPGREKDDGPGAVVSHAGFVVREAMVMRHRIRVACVGGVFTAAAHRGQGLASRVLADVLARARPGTDLVLASGDRDLYRRQGLDSVPPLARFRLPDPAKAVTHAGSAAWETREAKQSDLNSLAALYDAEDVHFIRPADDWRRLWETGLLVDMAALFFVVLRAGSIVAYVATQRAGRRPDGSVWPRRILEIAGDRAAIIAVAPGLADELLVPVYDAETIGACERAGWLRTARQFLITAEALTTAVRVIPWYGLNYL